MKAAGRKVKKDPNKPKAALSAFMYFGGDMRKTLKEEQPDLAFTAIGKEIGVRWKALDEEAKKPYEAQAAADKARHATEMEGYEATPVAFELATGSKGDKSKQAQQQVMEHAPEGKDPGGPVGCGGDGGSGGEGGGGWGGAGKSGKQADGTPENPFPSDDSAAPWGMRACSNCGQRNLLKGAPHDTCDNPDRRPPADGGIGGGDGGDGGGGGAQPGQILCAGYCEQAFDADEMKPCSSGGCGMSKSKKKKKKKSGKGTAGMAGTASTAAMLCSKCYIGAENMLGCKNELGGNNEFGGFSPNKTSSCKTSGLCSACWSVAAMDMHGCGSCSYMEVCVNGVNTTVCDACFKADPWPSTCKGCHSNCPSCEDVVASDDSDGLCYSCYLEAMNE
jgi:hypothetical protein